MKNIVVERFTLSDLNSISNTLETEFDNFWNYNILKKELESSNSFYWCIKQDNYIIGFAGFTKVLDIAEITNIVIKKNKRGNGYSSILLHKMIDEAKNMNCTKIELEVSSSNIVAINLYKEFECGQNGCRKNYYNNSDALLLTKGLK